MNGKHPNLMKIITIWARCPMSLTQKKCEHNYNIALDVQNRVKQTVIIEFPINRRNLSKVQIHKTIARDRFCIMKTETSRKYRTSGSSHVLSNSGCFFFSFPLSFPSPFSFSFTFSVTTSFSFFPLCCYFQTKLFILNNLGNNLGKCHLFINPIKFIQQKHLDSCFCKPH